MGAPRKVIPIQAEAEPALVSLFEAHKTVHPRTVSGLFSNWRWAMVWLTQVLFYGLPWLPWGERQALLFDLEARRFYIFNLVLYPQDFIYLAGLLVVSALALFLFTAVAGRLWCGFSCPQTVYTEIFLWIERKIEGDRGARIKLDAAPWSMEKFVKKWFKHICWGVFALWTGFTFVGYFTPIRELAMSFITTQWGPWETFWVLFYALATYGNAGFLREQVCKYMCPYARFQSAMFDRDTLIVSYDQLRGEPRGSRPRNADPAERGLGACIDCTLCVQVCPTGIDIRHGLQYECIGCGACADVCDSVMDKMGYARGLVKFTTQQGLQQGWSRAQIWRRVLRPRVLVYTAVLLAISLGLALSLALRTPFKVDVVRDRGAMARIVAGGAIENVYRLQIMNATESPQRYAIGVQGLAGLTVASEPEVAVDATASRWVAVRLQLPHGGAASGSHPIHFELRALDGGSSVREKSVFLVPR
jgi:cytochrome c oxidase accessory protein FixG